MAVSYRYVSVLLPGPHHNRNSLFIMKNTHTCNTTYWSINIIKKKNAVISALDYERSEPRFESRRPEFRFFFYASKMEEKQQYPISDIYSQQLQFSGTTHTPHNYRSHLVFDHFWRFFINRFHDLVSFAKQIRTSVRPLSFTDTAVRAFPSRQFVVFYLSNDKRDRTTSKLSCLWMSKFVW